MPVEQFVSYAQNLEDVMLWRALREAVPGPGFYVDVGASDPSLLSVTRAFYERGWHGLNVEPLPDAAIRLQEARPRDTTVAAALGAVPGRRPFFRVAKDGQSGLSTLDEAAAREHEAEGAAVEALEVPVTTLASLCAEHVDGPVHFLKIDAEGAEADILAGADFRSVRPWIVVLEATRPGSSDDSAGWEPALVDAGYRFVWFDGLNRFYLAEEHADLARHFAVQPNVFDGYVQQDVLLDQHVRSVQALAQERLQLIGRLEDKVAALETALEAALETAREAAYAEAPPGPEPVPAPPAAAPLVPPGPDPASYAMDPLWRRTARRLFFAVVRPVSRPLSHRVRLFMTGELIREMADLRAKQDLLLAQLHLWSANAARTDDRSADGAGGAMERMLLTLALEDAAEPREPGLSNPDHVV